MSQAEPNQYYDTQPQPNGGCWSGAKGGCWGGAIGGCLLPMLLLFLAPMASPILAVFLGAIGVVIGLIVDGFRQNSISQSPNGAQGKGGSKMKIAIVVSVAFVLALVMLAKYSSKPVEDQPDLKEIVGVWECSEFPPGFLAKAGVPAGSRKSRIVIGENGACSASNMPQRSPYGFVEQMGSSWTLAAPSHTPSGSWSVEFDFIFLQCRRKGGELELRYLISGMDEYYVTYRRVKQ